MKDGKNEIFHITDGRFSLDPGAAFGIVPRPVWSRTEKENSNGRIDLTTNMLLIKNDRWVAMFDSGLSSNYSDRMKKIFEIRPSGTFWQDAEKLLNGRKIDHFFQTHLHFDHVGRALEYISSGNRSSMIAQENEIRDCRKLNELSRSSYPEFPRKRNMFRPVSGSKRINSSVSVIYTGGHTAGHQALVYKGKREIIDFGDIMPSTFHIRPGYITAIDHFPLQTLEMKKKLIRKAVNDRAIVMLNHDIETPFVELSGDPEKPEIHPYIFGSE